LKEIVARGEIVKQDIILKHEQEFCPFAEETERTLFSRLLNYIRLQMAS